jgi:hypothetical protein
MCNGDIIRAKIEYIRGRLLAGVIDYETAKAEAAPVIAEMNAKGAEIARKHSMRFRPFTFGYLMR